MVLSIEERKLFFKNWLGLLSFVNKKHKVIKNFGNPKNPFGLNIDDIKEIREKLWKNTLIIDEYLHNCKISKEDIMIISLWKKRIKGKYMVIKDLKKFTVLMDFENKKLYGVHGISNSINEMIPSIPMMVETVLLPFSGKIIFDSIMGIDNVYFGKNMRQSFHEEYMELKNSIGIINKIE